MALWIVRDEWLVGVVAQLAVAACTSPLGAQATRPHVAPPHIEDNSFLIEEAYNQETDVVQHISSWQRSLNTGTWNFSFTQEWPVAGQTNQLSYTLLIGDDGRTGAEFGGAQLNYRYQLDPVDGRVAIAPRVSALLPARRDHLGGQVEVPISIKLGTALVMHGNAGIMETTRATTLYNLGGSVVWLARPTFNVLCELTWSTEAGTSLMFLNPGIRWAYNFAGGLQIVPGLSYTIGVGPAGGTDAAFVYLSFEHPFGGGGAPR